MFLHIEGWKKLNFCIYIISGYASYWWLILYETVVYYKQIVIHETKLGDTGHKQWPTGAHTSAYYRDLQKEAHSLHSSYIRSSWYCRINSVCERQLLRMPRENLEQEDNSRCQYSPAWRAAEMQDWMWIGTWKPNLPLLPVSPSVLRLKCTVF